MFTYLFLKLINHKKKQWFSVVHIFRVRDEDVKYIRALAFLWFFFLFLKWLLANIYSDCIFIEGLFWRLFPPVNNHFFILGYGTQVEEDGQQKHLSKTRVEDESQKIRLEQTIKDKLQKLGHEKIGEIDR